MPKNDVVELGLGLGWARMALECRRSGVTGMAAMGASRLTDHRTGEGEPWPCTALAVANLLSDGEMESMMGALSI